MVIRRRAKVWLEWNDGHKAEIGSIEIGPKVSESKLEVECKTKVRNVRIGWEIMKAGLRAMFTGPGWELEEDE